MEYRKKTWTDGDVIDADGLNNIETGVTEANKAAEEAKTLANGKAPAYTYGTEDIEAGSPSPYPNGTLHFVYE